MTKGLAISLDRNLALSLNLTLDFLEKYLNYKIICCLKLFNMMNEQCNKIPTFKEVLDFIQWPEATESLKWCQCYGKFWLMIRILVHIREVLMKFFSMVLQCDLFHRNFTIRLFWVFVSRMFV